ncbi:MAG: hypothetical protein ACQEQL_03630 [Pseudomonadota bacterium]
MAQERIFEQKNVGGAFNAAVHSFQPRGNFYELPLDKEKRFKAVFTRSDNHANIANRGLWQDVKIQTPNGTSQFENLEALKKRTEDLSAAGHDYAPMFEKVLHKYETLNQARPTQTPGLKRTH